MSSSAEHVAIARSMYDAFERGDIDAVYPLLAPGVLWELTGTSKVPTFGTYHGIDEVRRFFGLLAEHVRIDSFQVTSLVGTETGAVAEGAEGGHFVGHPLRFDMRWCQVLQITDGQITRLTGYHDTAPMVDSWRS